MSHEKGLKNINQSNSLLAPGVGMNIRTLNQITPSGNLGCKDDSKVKLHRNDDDGCMIKILGSR